MKLSRRRFLQAAAAVAVPPSLPRTASAQAYPSRPVRIVVPFPGGNASDIVARLTAQWLSERLGQQFIVDNRPGAGGNIGTEFVVKAPPDGYTLLSVGPSASANATLYDSLNFNFIRDIAPVAGVAAAPYILVVNPAFPVRSVPELIAYAKANSGKINMASAGNGSLSHMCGELFKAMAGIDLVHVPYRGSFLPDILGGQVQMVFSPISQSIGYIRSGKLRVLAVTATKREAELPDIPAMAEFLPGYEARGWYGIGAPKNTPVVIIEKLEREIETALGDRTRAARLADIGAVPMPMKPAAFGAYIAAETEKWGKLIRAGNIKAE